VILLVTAPMSILRSFFLAGYTASVPILVGRSQLARANSIFEAIYSAGYIVGPAIAGLLSATIGPGLTLAIDAVSFGGSAIALAAVRGDLRAPIDRTPGSLLADVREGFTFVVRHPLLRSMVTFWGLVAITTAPLVTSLAVHVTRDLAMTDAILGLLLTAYGVGTVVGSLLTARGARRRLAPALLGGTLVTGVLLVALTLTNVVPIMLVIAGIAGISQSVVLVTYLTTRTTHSPDALLGRIGSVARTFSLGLQPLGLLAGGALIDLTDGSTTIAAMGAILILLSLGFAPLETLRSATVTPSTRPGA
jgi:predicted MFS family arabinose efflux permease